MKRVDLLVGVIGLAVLVGAWLLVRYWYRCRRQIAACGPLSSLVDQEVEDASPWLQELQRTRSQTKLAADAAADIVIVGGGIAGVMTAYWILTTTQASVILLEARTVGSGATGHNAGQAATYFERPTESMIAAFGFEQTMQAHAAIESAWDLLQQLYTNAQLKTPHYIFVGYDGFITIKQVISALQENAYRVRAGLSPKSLYVVDDPAVLAAIPTQFDGLYQQVGRDAIMDMLQTREPSYVAVSAEQRGCMNSAMLTEEVVSYLIKEFPARFSVHEQSPVSTITVHADRAELAVNTQRVTAGRVMLCTNGYTDFTIINTAGPSIQDKFERTLKPRIGYMIGYLDYTDAPAYAASYYDPSQLSAHRGFELTTYFYLTRWPFRYAGSCGYSLVCVGGPEHHAPQWRVGHLRPTCSRQVRQILQAFMARQYRPHETSAKTAAFCWSGVMGYTTSMMRLIGPEPYNPVLWYNLGCNGVGILPSIYGAYKISQMLTGTAYGPSLFDPQ